MKPTEQEYCVDLSSDNCFATTNEVFHDCDRITSAAPCSQVLSSIENNARKDL